MGRVPTTKSSEHAGLFQLDRSRRERKLEWFERESGAMRRNRLDHQIDVAVLNRR
jgi:hypothetical protein